ncbi:MAG: alkaline phosphatase family protein [Candidatus Wallbacteria bacterium]|nr:alkaline phosphatase family protein [Candidatus Wallbacteria bacterium]
MMRLGLVAAIACLAWAAPLAGAPAGSPDTSGLERAHAGGAVRDRGAPPADLGTLARAILKSPDGPMARRLPALAAALAFYKDRLAGEDLVSYGRRKAPDDEAGIRAVLAAHGVLPERATQVQRDRAIQRLANVEYPLRDRAAATEVLNYFMVLAASEEARGHDGAPYRKAYEQFRTACVTGLQAAGGGGELLADGFQESQLHGAQDLEPVENLVLGFRPALEQVLAAAAAEGAAEPVADLAQRVESASVLRERREGLRETAVEAAKAAAFAEALAARGDAAGSARQRARAQKLQAELNARLADPRFAASAASDAADLLAYLRRRALRDPLLAGGPGRELAALLVRKHPEAGETAAPAPSVADCTAWQKEVDRLLLLSSRGPYLLLIDIDGLRPDKLEEMLTSREGLGQEALPNFDRFVARRGAFLRNHVTCFPSSTYPGTTTFLTGRHSKSHRIQSNTLFFKDIKDAQDRASLSAARKRNWVDYLSTKQGKFAAEDVPGDHPYIFEMLQPAALTFFPTSRGVHPRFSKDGFLMGMTGMFFEHDGSYVPFGDRGFDDLTITAAYEMVNDGNPYTKDGRAFLPAKLMGHYFAWIDHASHAAVQGQAGPEVRRFLEYQDRLFGRLMRMIERLGIMEELVVAIISDHGHFAGPAETGSESAPAKDGNVPYSLSKRFEEKGFKLRRSDKSFQEYDACLITDGEGTVRVYLPRSGTHRWDNRHTFDQLKAYTRARDGMPVNILETMFFVSGPDGRLSVNPAVDVGMMVGRDMPTAGLREYVVYTAKPLAGSSRQKRSGDVRDRGAFSVIRRSTQDGQLRYRYVYRKGLDPLGYEQKVPAVRDASGPVEDGWYQTDYIDERDWLAMTMDTDYPDAPFAIDNFFSGPDQTDLIVSAKPGYCFDESAKDRSDHGYLLAPSMRSTLLIAGRGIKRGMVSTRPHRSVDMIPTVLTALGAKDVLARVKLDGRVADEILEEGFGK